MKIVIIDDLGLSKANIKTLENIGEVIIFDKQASSPDEWFERCKDSDVICTGKFGLKSERAYDLENKFISVPFIGTGFLDIRRLKSKNVIVANSPGCNKNAVSEWIIGMIINLLREFPKYINNKDLPKGEIPKDSFGLADQDITILGKGHIGSRVGEICEKFGMSVEYFDKGDNLIEKVQNAKVIINTLSLNESTVGLLNKNFFNSLNKETYFITVTSSKIYDIDAMIEALDSGILAGVADDNGSILVGDIEDPQYLKLADHSKVLATPHVAYNTENRCLVCNNMMVENVKAWAKEKPINLVE
jgi:glycerate dehydrogenase